MNMLIVAYDLNKESKRPPIVEEIKKYEWARLSESAYAIRTNQSPNDVYERLAGFIDQDDNIYILHIHRPWMGFGRKPVVDWLDKHLTACRR